MVTPFYTVKQHGRGSNKQAGVSMEIKTAQLEEQTLSVSMDNKACELNSWKIILRGHPRPKWTQGTKRKKAVHACDGVPEPLFPSLLQREHLHTERFYTLNFWVGHHLNEDVTAAFICQDCCNKRP